MDRRRSAAASMVLVAAMAVSAGCESDLFSEQLAWCTRNQDDVAREALRVGLMDPGEDYDAWKADSGAYRDACEIAWDGR
jgi:hypothetical protein